MIKFLDKISQPTADYIAARAELAELAYYVEIVYSLCFLGLVLGFVAIVILAASAPLVPDHLFPDRLSSDEED